MAGMRYDKYSLWRRWPEMVGSSQKSNWRWDYFSKDCLKLDGPGLYAIFKRLYIFFKCWKFQILLFSKKVRKEIEESFGMFNFWNEILKFNKLFDRHVLKLAPEYYSAQMGACQTILFQIIKCVSKNLSVISYGTIIQWQLQHMSIE
jgi:hypothetical protein